MFKVISAELKKTVSKPGIYILAVILAVILILGVFVYNPTPSTNTAITLKGVTFLDKYEDFNHATGGYKKIVDDNISLTIDSVNNYTFNSSTKHEQIKKLFSDYQTAYLNYRNCSTDASYDLYIQTAKANLITSLNNLNNEISSTLAKSSNNSYAIITTNKNYNEYKDIFKEILAWANVTVEKSKLADHCKDFENSYQTKFLNIVNNFKYPQLQTGVINSFTATTPGTKLNIIKDRLSIIEQEIGINYNTAKTNAEQNTVLATKMDQLANSYLETANTYINLVKYTLISNAFEYTNTAEQLDLMFLKDYDVYTSNSLQIKYDYLFSKNKVESNFANPLTIGLTSNYETNAFDYSYFILKLFSFVIIAYSIMSACHSIAGEIKDGSMRYYAIRPVSRSKIYFGKLLAILIMTFILTTFSTIISVCVGGAVYGFNSLNILTIFNSQLAVVINPILMLVLYVLSFIFEVAIYTSIAMLISCLLKSDLLAITIALILYLINIMLPLFAQGANTWLCFYPFSHISIYPLFGSAMFSSTNFFGLLLGSKIYATTNLVLTIFVITLMLLIINAVAIKIFKNKEL